jgi:hypothetical protein
MVAVESGLRIGDWGLVLLCGSQKSKVKNPLSLEVLSHLQAGHLFSPRCTKRINDGDSRDICRPEEDLQESSVRIAPYPSPQSPDKELIRILSR